MALIPLEQRASALLNDLVGSVTTMGCIGGPQNDVNSWIPRGFMGQSYVTILEHLTEHESYAFKAGYLAGLKDAREQHAAQQQKENGNAAQGA